MWENKASSDFLLS